MIAKYLSLNSEILPTAKPCLSFDNRGLLYADTFSFKIRGNSSKVFFLDSYFDFMISAMRQLKMERPLLLKKSIFATDIELLLQKNRIYKGFTGNISVFRNSSHARLAENNTVSLLITVESTESEFYRVSSKGLKTNVLKNYSLPDHVFISSFTPYFNPELFLMPVLNQYECDDLLITDLNKNIVKSIFGSVFFVKNGSIIVPERIPINADQVFSNIIVSVARQLNIEVLTKDVKSEDLYNFDELFIADVSNGIRFVMALGDKRYLNKVSSIIIKRVNEIVS
jgi:branched-subunit amino acid aminotransferase/4-amino-4-deoxychorismate lyase